MTKRAVIITTSVLVGLITIFTILFGVVFRVRNIKVVSGDDFYYKTQINEVLTTSKLKKNSSIFSVNRTKVKNNIEKNYPYARVNVNISSFNSVKITLSNRTPLYYFIENEVCFILDEDCKVLESIGLQDYNNNTYQLILLTDVFSAGENNVVGQFLENKYTSVCNNLYKALYSNAMIEVDNGGNFESSYLDREDMCEVISLVKFSQVTELNGKVDKLHLTTSYGVEITIIEPQTNLDYKINMAFSALRTLQQRDRQNGTTLIQSGSINVEYKYDSNNNQSLNCEYRTD